MFPVTLGTGKRLFAEGTIPSPFTLREANISPRGVTIASYERAGDVEKGSFAMKEPSEAEIARRKKIHEEA